MSSDLSDFIQGLISNIDVFTTLTPEEIKFPAREDRMPYPLDSPSYQPQKCDKEELNRQRNAAEKEFWDSL
jgi:hypothetical protein